MSFISIAGLQKTTLVDYPDKVACTVFTSGCNFRCPYCHNGSLVLDSMNEPEISQEALLAFLDQRKGILDGVCFTGGEPLLHKDLGELVGLVKSMGYSVKLDTNGSYPKRLKKLLNLGVIDYVAMDIKHARTSYNSAIGSNHDFMEEIEESVLLLMKGDIPYEFRTTVVKGLHTIESMKNIGQWIQGAKAYYIQNYQCSEDTIATRMKNKQQLESFTEHELEGFAQVMRTYVENTLIR